MSEMKICGTLQDFIHNNTQQVKRVILRPKNWQTLIAPEHSEALKSTLDYQLDLIARDFKAFSSRLLPGVLVDTTAAGLRDLVHRSAVLEMEEMIEDIDISLPTVEKSDIDVLSPEPRSNWAIQHLEIQRIWETYGSDGKGIKIGHLDTGIDGGHPALLHAIDGWARFDSDGNKIDTPDETPFDSDQENGHGTHTAGILVGQIVDGKVTGVAPGASIYSALVCDMRPGSQRGILPILRGVEWLATKGVDVVCMSLGALGLKSQLWGPIAVIAAQNTVICSAIGNSGPETIRSPGAFPMVFGIGATDVNNEVYHLSSGKSGLVWNELGLMASWTKPDLVAPGKDIWSSIPGGLYGSLTGTSMAAPCVAGVVALLRTLKPGLSSAEVLKVLNSTATDIGTPGLDSRCGAGLIRPYEAARRVVER